MEVCISFNKPYSSFLNKEKKKSRYNEIIIGLNCERELLHLLINKRVDKMLQNGLIEESKNLIKFKDLNALNTIGYKEIFKFLENKLTIEEAVEKIKTNTRRYAKRQLTWFKSNEKINWFDYNYDIINIKKLIDSIALQCNN